ncbi:MAG TPA: NADPH-dependent F420 reductase [bacterium]|jgi:predicted dinucleotide-binding enzyme|nr:NADPH-dependent F420 reductase [bacterium]
MRIGVLGSGLMGAKLGTLWAQAGYEVVFSYSHSRQKLERLAKDAKGKASAGTPREAADGADALLLAVHWDNVKDVLDQAGDLTGKIILSCVLPMDGGNTDLVVAHRSSGGEELQKMASTSRFVAAFNTVPSEVLFKVFADRKGVKRPNVIICGDDGGAKKVASGLIHDLGFDAVDAGPMKVSRYLEPFGLLIGQLAYEAGPSPELSYRFDWHNK